MKYAWKTTPVGGCFRVQASGVHVANYLSVIASRRKAHGERWKMRFDRQTLVATFTRLV